MEERKKQGYGDALDWFSSNHAEYKCRNQGGRMKTLYILGWKQGCGTR